MAEENRGDRSGSRSDGRNRRRRYYKRKGGDRQGTGEGQGGATQSGTMQSGTTQPAAQASSQGGAQPTGQRDGQKSNEAKSSGQQGQRSQKNGQPAQQHGQNAQQAADSGRTRGVRKRRRSRSRRGDFRPETPLPIEKDQEYIAPKSVYVYTHVARPSNRDAYEFRSEHFSRVGHTLDDFNVDLTLIFDVPRPDFGAKVAVAFSEMEEAGDIATEARFQPWVEFIEGGVKPAPAQVEGSTLSSVAPAIETVPQAIETVPQAIETVSQAIETVPQAIEPVPQAVDVTTDAVVSKAEVEDWPQPETEPLQQPHGAQGQTPTETTGEDVASA